MVGAEVSEEAVVFQPCDGKRNLTHTQLFSIFARGAQLGKVGGQAGAPNAAEGDPEEEREEQAAGAEEGNQEHGERA